MEKLQFTTNIKCSGCVAKNTPNLNQVAGEGNWDVDLNSPAKILTVTADPSVSSEAVIKAVNAAGYTAATIS